MYLENNTEYKKHIETLKHRNNVRVVKGEIIKNGSKFECVTCKSTLSQYSVDQHLKTNLYLDNVKGKNKDITGDDNNNIAREDNGETWSETHNKTVGYCNICNTRYNTKNEQNESDENKEIVKQKKFVVKNWCDKVIELGLDHNMKYNQK